MIRPLFIWGCDRSGTHMLARALDTPETVVSLESQPIFSIAQAIARNPVRFDGLYPKLKGLYDKVLDQYADKKWFVEKSHMNIWYAEALLRDYPEAKGLIIERGVGATVASMKRHRGVIFDLITSRCFSMPNPYMGIADESYWDLSPVTCMVLKWKAHRQKTAQLMEHQSRFRVRAVRYEDIVVHPEWWADQLSNVFGIKVPVPKTDESRIDAWENELNEKDLQQIKMALDMSYWEGV